MSINKLYLKAILKDKYLTIKNGFEEYNCGHKMLLTISSEYYNLCKEFNKVADKLSKIDENTPKFRYDLNPRRR